jgi:hypothetical protein
MSSELKYHLISGRHAFCSQENNFRKEVFRFWSTVWTSVYAELGVGNLYADDFTRQDLIGAVTIGGELAAAHLYSIHDLSCETTRAMKYFDYYDQDFWDKLKDVGPIQRVMTMEFLTVNSKFRANITGFSVARAMSQVGCQLSKVAGADGIIAPARQDYRVHEYSYDLGFTGVQKNVIRNNVLCDMIACHKDNFKTSGDLSVARAGKLMWENRIIHPSAQLWLDSHSLASRTQIAPLRKAG